jgi:hypothetical protein
MKSLIDRLPMVFAVSLLIVLAFPAESQVRFGVRAGEYTDLSEPFIGIEFITPITPRWYFNPNIEFVFVDPGDLITLNGDVHYDFETGSIVMPWVGGGLALIYADIGERDTSLGLNVLAGVGWRVSREIIPYVQIKGIVGGDHEDFVIMGGVRF